jgi:hypothetical protein
MATTRNDPGTALGRLLARVGRAARFAVLHQEPVGGVGRSAAHDRGRRRGTQPARPFRE